MRFEHNGIRYLIEFQRSKRRLYKGRIESKYPYTTVRILQYNPVTAQYDLVPNWTATVGYWVKEQVPFTAEQGRVQALKKLTAALPAEFKPLVWDTYNNRFRR